MENDGKKRAYTFADIEKYVSGKMNTAEMHELEKAALEDPLLDEALDGYRNAFQPGKPDILKKNLAAVNSKIAQRMTTSGASRNDLWFRIAAAVLVILICGYLFKVFIKDHPTPTALPVAQDISKVVKDKTAIADSVSTGAGLIKNNTSGGKEIHTSPAAAQKDNISGTTIGKNNPATQNTTNNPPSTDGNSYSYSSNLPAPANINHEITPVNRSNKFIKKEKTLASNDAYSNNRMAMMYFRGKVTDNKGIPISYTTVIINSRKQSRTDALGYFNLPYPDSAVNLTFIAANYTSKEIRMIAGEYKKIILETSRVNFIQNKNVNSAAEVRVINKNAAEPKDGWQKYLQYLTSQVSNSVYDTGEKVTGEIIVDFWIDQDGEPGNFTFEKTISEDVESAIRDLIINGPEWKLSYPGSVAGSVSLYIKF